MDWEPFPSAVAAAVAGPSSRGGGGSSDARGARAAALEAAAAADVAQLVAMGFSAKQARDALDECGGDVEGAIEWLVQHCI